MYRTIYLSAASHMFSTEDLNAILSVSRRNNQSDGISGLLLYHEGSILQVLEGDQSRVDACFERIKMDGRHRGLLRLFHGKVDRKVFPNWSMGFAWPNDIKDGADASLKGLDQVVKELPSLHSVDRRSAILIRSFFASHGDLAALLVS